MGKKLSSYERKRKVKYTRPFFLIACEDSVGSVAYFSSFPYNKHYSNDRKKHRIIRIEGGAGQHKKVVEKAKEMYDEIASQGIEVHPKEVWCVFDRDDNPDETHDNFLQAIKLAEKYEFNPIFSVQCIELWYLLHFHYYDTAISRGLYDSKLSKLLEGNYKHEDKDMYRKLKSRQDTAIKNAEKLYQNHFENLVDPITTVHLLVDSLNKAYDAIKDSIY